MKYLKHRWWQAVASLLIAPTVAAYQDPAQINDAIDAFLRTQLRGLPGESSFKIGKVSPNNQLPPCNALEVTMAPSAKVWGRTSVMVRCQETKGWTIYVPVHIRVIADYLVTAMPLTQGQTIAPANLARRRGDLSDLPAGTLTDEAEAVGKTISVSVGPGRPLRADLLRQPMVIRQNQTVKVVSKGSGFQVTNEGRALTNGLEGQVVQVRLGNGQVISGIARVGAVVEVVF